MEPLYTQDKKRLHKFFCFTANVMLTLKKKLCGLQHCNHFQHTLKNTFPFVQDVEAELYIDA